MKRMRRFLLVGLCFLYVLKGAYGQEVLLGATSGAVGSLYNINPSNGVATPIGFLTDGIGNPFGITGMAFDPLTGLLYGSTSNNSFTDKQSLVSIDPNSGMVTFIGFFGVGTTMADLTFDTTTSTLFGTGALNGNLYTVNPATGVATLVGDAGFAPLSTVGNGLAATAGGQLFGSPQGSSGPLVLFNKSNGSVTTVATLSGAPFPTGAIGAMAFNAAGTLFGVNIDQSIPTSRLADLVTIDTGTGAVTNVGATGVNNLDAIVFFNPTAVPEPTTTVLFGTGLIFLGVRRYRHQSSAT